MFFRIPAVKPVPDSFGNYRTAFFDKVTMNLKNFCPYCVKIMIQFLCGPVFPLGAFFCLIPLFGRNTAFNHYLLTPAVNCNSDKDRSFATFYKLVLLDAKQHIQSASGFLGVHTLCFFGCKIMFPCPESFCAKHCKSMKNTLKRRTFNAPKKVLLLVHLQTAPECRILPYRHIRKNP